MKMRFIGDIHANFDKYINLTSLWESEHKPKLWIFGHYHHNIDRVINGCRFICIDSCDHVDIDFTQYV